MMHHSVVLVPFWLLQNVEDYSLMQTHEQERGFSFSIVCCLNPIQSLQHSLTTTGKDSSYGVPRTDIDNSQPERLLTHLSKYSEGLMHINHSLEYFSLTWENIFTWERLFIWTRKNSHEYLLGQQFETKSFCIHTEYSNWDDSQHLCDFCSEFFLSFYVNISVHRARMSLAIIIYMYSDEHIYVYFTIYV